METSHRRLEHLKRLHIRERILVQQHAAAQCAEERERVATLTWLLRLVRAAQVRLEQGA